MERIELKVEGMTCGGCESSVQKALTQKNGITTVIADSKSGVVTIEFDSESIQQPEISSAITEAGFDVVS